MNATTEVHAPAHAHAGDGTTRRDFLTLLALAGAAVGGGAIVWAVHR